MAGTIPLSMTQQFDIYGKPLAGGQLYLIQAGTVSTPQNGYQDSALSIPLPNPITLDAAGRIPQFFLADGSIKVRLQDKSGVVQLAADNILVIGPSAGGGGGSAVDPTTLIQTGNLIFRYGVGVFAGYVRLNGLTIGSSTSGATERGNADTQSLFQYLWGADPTLVLTPSRGATAAADWGANKQLALPDWRGYAVGALDDMGNTAAGRLSPTYFGSSPIVLGAVGGGENSPVAVANLPPHAHTGTTGNESAVHQHPGIPVPANKNTGALVNAGASLFFWTGTAADQFTGSENVFHTHDFTTGNGPGSSTPLRTIGPRKLCTFYIKL